MADTEPDGHGAHLPDNALEQDRARYLSLVARRPDDAQAWYALSGINARLGRIAEAGECCRRAIALQPAFADAHLNLGNVLLHEGRRAEAVAAYRTVLKLVPGHTGAALNLGHALADQGNGTEALEQYAAVLRTAPGAAAARGLLGRARALTTAGRLQEAADLLALLCGTHPGEADAWQLLGSIYGRRGDTAAAEDCCRRALAARPGYRDAHVTLGHVLFHQGRLDEAADAYLNALAIDPHYAAALNNLGRASAGGTRFAAYVAAYRAAVAAAPDPSALRGAFIGAVENMRPAAYDPWLDEELQHCLAMDEVDLRTLALTAAYLLRLKYNLDTVEMDDRARLQALVEDLAGDRLFALFLSKTINIDADLERLLVRLRRLLLHLHADGGLADGGRAVALALARQCFINEHVYAVEEEEKALLAPVACTIADRAAAGDAPDAVLEAALLVYGMYEAPYALPCWGGLAARPASVWSPALRPWIGETLHERWEEDEAQEGIPALNAVRDRTSQWVRSQYEENPYPRWRALPEVQPTAIGPALRRRFPHFTPPAFLDGPVRILAAGCGTGKQPIHAALSYRGQGVHITAVDISRRSLAYASRMARRYGADNVEFLHGDILELEGLGRRFHIIECQGVLHHMEDPVRGWRALAGLLVDGGLMSIGLYSRVARRGLARLQAMVQELALSRDRDGVRALRRRLLEDPARRFEILSYDFYSTSGCRDLLFHFMEHQYTPLQLDAVMRELGLEFLGFVPRDAATLQRYRGLYPQDRTLTDLHNWELYERRFPDTFAKMFQFWCRKA